MSDSFEFTLNSRLIQEDWDKLMDVELEHTTKICYKTPGGKKVAFVPLSIIEDIKAEIRKIDDLEVVNGGVYIRAFDVIEIIDKHIGGKEPE